MNVKHIFAVAVFLLIAISFTAAQEKSKSAPSAAPASAATPAPASDLKMPLREDSLRFANLMLMIQNRRAEKEKLEAQAHAAEMEAQSLEQKLDPLIKEIASANKIDLTRYEPQFDPQKGLIFKSREEKDTRKP